jgi:hypothetical protein
MENMVGYLTVLTRRVSSLESSFGDPLKLTTQKVGQKSKLYIARVVRTLKSDGLGVFHKVSTIHFRQFPLLSILIIIYTFRTTCHHSISSAGTGD